MATPADEFERLVRARVDALASAKLTRARSMQRQGEHLIKRAAEEAKKVEWYRTSHRGPSDPAARSEREAALGLHLDGMVGRLSPDLPPSVAEALTKQTDELRDLIANSPTPESLREVRAHLLMVRRHLEHARRDLVARLWASPVGEMSGERPDHALVERIKDRVERVSRVGCGDMAVSRGRLSAVLYPAIVESLGQTVADYALRDWHGKRGYAKKPARREHHSGSSEPRGEWGRTLRSPSSIEATTNAERLLRAVYPEVMKIQARLADLKLSHAEAETALRHEVNAAIEHAAQTLGIRAAFLRASVSTVISGRGFGLSLQFNMPAEADQKLLEGVLRELATEHHRREAQ